MPIDFPASPTNGQTYTVGSRSWTWSTANSSWDATSITTGPKGGVPYTFSTVITDTDPGNGTVQYNSATIGSVTFLYIDNVDASGNTQTTWYDTWDDSTTTATRGTIYIAGNAAGSTTINVFTITGAVTNATTYYKIPVTYVSGTLPTNGSSISIEFARTGNQGTQGTEGSQGRIGTQGAVGTQGAIGAQGTIGSQGTQGVNGTQGLSGAQGFAQISMPAAAVNGAIWVDTDGIPESQDNTVMIIMGAYV